MAGGVRIRHTTLRGPAIVAVRDRMTRGEPDPEGNYPGCAACSLPSPGHEGYKTKHVRIDSDGYAIVAPEYWLDMKRFIDNGGFEETNPVSAPPKQQLLMNVDEHGNAQGKLVVHHKMGQPINTKGLFSRWRRSSSTTSGTRS